MIHEASCSITEAGYSRSKTVVWNTEITNHEYASRIAKKI